MKKLYYIEHLDLYLKNMSNQQDLPIPLGENIIEITSDEQRFLLLDAITRTAFINDFTVKKSIDDNLPLFSRYVEKIPIPLKEFKEEIESIFSQIPDELLEERNTIIALRNILNFIIKKNEISFIGINILNGKLEYDGKYPYTKIYQGYFKMMRLNNNLDEYFNYIINTQRLMEKVYLKELFFSNKEFTNNELRLFEEAYNNMGRILLEFRTYLEKTSQNITKEKSFLKRTNISTPKGYWEQEEQLSKKIDETLLKLENKINQIIDRKQNIRNYIKENKNLISLENIKTLLELLKLGDFFTKR